MDVSAKLKTLRSKHVLKRGGLVAHHTSTLAGVASSARVAVGVKKVQVFKQRTAPFLVLADSISTALKQAVFITPPLRKLAANSWPGSVTLVFSARKNLCKPCYKQGKIAVRVDTDVETRRLAKICGGLLLSSSLNRKGQAVQKPDLNLKYRWKRYLTSVFPTKQSFAGTPSQIFRVSGKKIDQLR